MRQRYTHEELKNWLKTHKIAGGASSLNYQWPVTASATTPPTAPTHTNSVRVAATLDGSDTTITITHNLGFSTAELAQGLPEITLTPTHAAGHTSDVFVSSITANTVVLTYLAVAFSVDVVIRRPQSSIE